MKKPVLLLLNDIHISKDNIPDFRDNWSEALEICKSKNIRVIALGGDLFMSRVSQTLDVLLAVHDALAHAAAAGIHVTIAEGNHDLVDQESLRGYCHIFDRYPGITVVDDYITLDDPSWDFVLHVMSYFPENGSFTDKLNSLLHGGMVGERLNYLYIHEGINGALATPADDELPPHIFQPFDKVFVGHYHNRAQIKGTDIEYIGSSRQFNFGEDIDKGYTVLYHDGSYEFIRNEVNNRYTVIDVKAQDVTVHLLDRLDEMKADTRMRLKVRVHGSEALTAGIDKKKIHEAGANKVEFVNEDIEIVDTPQMGVLDKFDPVKIRESYEKFCSHKRIEDVALGLTYLSKINASCGS